MLTFLVNNVRLFSDDVDYAVPHLPHTYLRNHVFIIRSQKQSVSPAPTCIQKRYFFQTAIVSLKPLLMTEAD